jgi:hypothetical protein
MLTSPAVDDAAAPVHTDNAPLDPLAVAPDCTDTAPLGLTFSAIEQIATFVPLTEQSAPARVADSPAVISTWLAMIPIEAPFM